MKTACFAKGLPKPSKAKSGNGGGAPVRGYAALLASALDLGFTYTDMRHMPYGRLMWVLDEWRRMNSTDKQDGVREATQQDIDKFFG